MIPAGLELVMFDLDGTLISEHADQHFSSKSYLSISKAVLKYFKHRGVKTAVVTLNKNANDILNQLSISHLFDIVEYKKRCTFFSKRNMLKRVLMKTNIEPKNSILFDNTFFIVKKRRFWE